MRIPRFSGPTRSVRIRPGRRLVDLGIILAVFAALVAIRVDAPSNTHNYAQLWQIHASIDHLNGGSLILPKIDSRGTPARKPQLYAWILTAVMKTTGLRNDFVFRVPTLLAGAGLAVLTYLLGCRWYSRRVGLFAAVLFLTCMKMNKLIYLATTDMLLAFWIGACLFCVDRLTFHPAGRRGWWSLGFWVSMILAALSKGWGVVNFAIVGGWVALLGCVGPGFGYAARAESPIGVAGRVVRLLWRRLLASARAVHLVWGLLAMLVVFVPLWLAMLDIGGEPFRNTVYYEVWQRLTGEGQNAPDSTPGPALAHLYYITLPMSVFAGCALFVFPPAWRLHEHWIEAGRNRAGRIGAVVGWALAVVAGMRRSWLDRHSPIAMPIAWIAVVVMAFSIPSGFRPDYLLPCFPAVGLLAAVAMERLALSRWYHGRVARHVRRISQAVPLVLAVGLAGCAGWYLLHHFLPMTWAESLPLPPRMPRQTWWLLSVLSALAVIVGVMGLWAIRRCRMDWVMTASVVGMLGIIFLTAHFFTRQARTGDGDVMRQFARQIEPVVGDDPYALFLASKLAQEAYLGRFGEKLSGSGEEALARFEDGAYRWLITSDLGLLYLGAYDRDPAGSYRLKIGGKKQAFRPTPQDLGTVRARSIAPIQFEKWGSIYLIELQPPLQTRSEPFITGYISDPVR